MLSKKDKGLKRKSMRPVKIALYVECPYWVLLVSDTDCLELQRKDKKDVRRSGL